MADPHPAEEVQEEGGRAEDAARDAAADSADSTGLSLGNARGLATGEALVSQTDPACGDDPWGLVDSEFEGGLQVESVVGVGGFGTVYRAYHTRFRAPVALKVLRFPENLTAAQRVELLQRFDQETVLLFRLSRLTLNIASCLAAGTFTATGGVETPYIVQEWLEGQSLDQVLRPGSSPEGTQTRYNLQQVIELLDPAVDALTVAHEQGVVHRDIKPSNLFLVKREGVSQAKLLDFGIAKMLRDDLDVGTYKRTMTQGFRVLSIEYAAPEQWDEQLGPVSPKTDLFSLALVLVEMLTGRPALNGNGPHALMFSTMDPVHRPTPSAQGLIIPDAIDAHFLKALAVNPTQRPESLLDWWTKLKQLTVEHAPWATTVADCRAPSQKSPPPDNIATQSSNTQSSNTQSSNTQSSNTQSSNTQPPPKPNSSPSVPATADLAADDSPSTKRFDDSEEIEGFESAPASSRESDPETSAAFYERGEELTQEAGRQHRRKLGIWLTTGTVTACAALLLGLALSQKGDRGPSSEAPGFQQTVQAQRPELDRSPKPGPGQGADPRARGAMEPGSAQAQSAPHPPSAAETTAELNAELNAELTASAPVLPAQQPAGDRLQRVGSEVPGSAETGIDQKRSPGTVSAPAGAAAPASPANQGADAIQGDAHGGAAAKAGALAADDAKPVIAFDLEPAASVQNSVSEQTPVQTGELRLNSIPASAILIDGRPLGSTPKASVHLSPGPHNVVFVHPQLGKRRLLVLVEAGKSQTLSVKF